MLNIVLPGSSKDAVSLGLRYLTREIERRNLVPVTGYGLGGRWGYACDFKNAAFMLHPYCWCEGEECPWCGGWRTHIPEGVPPKAWTFFRDVANYPPLFLHYATGIGVSWYKWIGRSLIVHPEHLTVVWQEILGECLESIGAKPISLERVSKTMRRAAAHDQKILERAVQAAMRNVKG